MRKIYLTIVATLISIILLAQAPQGFNYTALVRNADGTAIKNKEIKLEVNLQNENGSEVYYSELHKVKTNSNGVVSVVIGTSDDVIQGKFEEIPWEKGNIFVQLKVNDKQLTATKLQSVPYALYAQSGGGNSANGDVLFAVKNKQGDTVFAVYPEGVRVYVDKNGKAQRGGFAVATRRFGKGTEPTEVFTVTPDSTRIYINEDKNGKAQRGGFAIATRGFNKHKGTNQSKDVFTVESDHNVNVVVDEKGKSKALRGGFAVATRGFNNHKGKENNKTIFTTNADSTRVYLNNNSKNKAHRGGFAIATRGFSKGDIKNNFNISNSKQAEVIKGENRILWYPKKNAFLAGHILIENADSVGENSFSSGYECQAIGAYSTAIGHKAVAKDSNSFALGESSMAIGKESYAFGRNAIALGKRSFAMGGSIPKGFDPKNPTFSLPGPKALGDYSYAFGFGAVSKGIGSISLGALNNADNLYSVSIGFLNSATNDASMALGSLCSSEGENAIAIGTANTASGKYSMALGYGARANGENSISLGYNTEAIGTSSFATGDKSKAEGDMATAMGKGSVAKGDNSFAVGMFAGSHGDGSIAMGSGVKAFKKSSIAMGQSSKAYENNDIAIGYNASAKGNSSTAIGNEVQATKAYSVAIGNNVESQGTRSVAMGSYINVRGNYSFGIGLKFQANPPLITQANTMAIMGGKVGINKVNPSFPLDVNGKIKATSVIESSDIRFKKDVRTLNSSLTKLLKLRGVTYYWKQSQFPDLNFDNKKQIGVIAQEVEKIFPELVQTDDDGYKSVSYAKFTPILIEAVKELNKENENLKAELQAQKQKITVLEKQNSEIQNLQKQIQELKEMFKAQK